MSAAALRESGTLPVGVEMDGEVHREFVLRPRLVRDSVDVLADEPQAQTNDAYRGVAITARQLERLGDLPRDKIDTGLLLGMFDTDLSAIMQAAERLEARLLTFRAADEGAAQAAPGAAEGGGAVGGGA